MNSENRNAVRYDDMGKVYCPEICPLHGGLDNISKTGCKVHFPLTVTVDLENEYEIRITLAKKPNDSPLVMMCKPQWVRECENTTEVGFLLMYSPDQNRYAAYVAELEEAEKENNFPEII
ncbi:MAG: PilZ domain-containing protein [Treponema sp.]|nr:PilZ domain-containing protein [Treponema sp.]